MSKRVGLLALALITSLPLLAQPRGTSQPGGLRSEMRFQGYFFENFFYTTNESQEEDITALGTEVRAAYRPGSRPIDVFGHLGLTRYGHEALSASFNARLGLVQESEAHDWTVFIDQAENRPSFEVGNTFARGDVTTLSGEYGWRFVPDWEVGGELVHQRQTFNVESDRENDYTGIGASIRYRGFGWRIAPEVGVLRGKRNVTDAAESYDSADAFLQVAWMPELTDNPLYLSLRYRDRDRSYTIGDRASRNFGRQEERGDWTFLADLRTSPNVSWLVYYSTESIDSSVPNSDFQVGVLLFGLTIGF